jgi:hypothetical protein
LPWPVSLDPVAVPNALPFTSFVVSLQMQLTSGPVFEHEATPASPQLPAHWDAAKFAHSAAFATLVSRRRPEVMAAMNDADTSNEGTRVMGILLTK